MTRARTLRRGAHRATLPTTLGLLATLAAIALPAAVHAFCGFFVGRAGADLFNEASQVVLVRHDDRTVITMANDYQGDPTEFALVVPVPTFIERGQIHVASMSLIDHLDAYTAPRLVEYFDPDPCSVRREMDGIALGAGRQSAPRSVSEKEHRVTIEATYIVGEYDILILSAEDSGGLESWLTENGYGIPRGASRVLESYIKQGMRFFVAKVNLKEQQRLGYTMLRPLQVAFESNKFMLPIRLGTVNAKGPQDLIIYALTRSGRVETTNYRTMKLPSDLEIPTYVKDEFDDFYRAMFDRQVEKQGMRTVFLEYAWNMSWCDPCAADPLSRDELRELGVFWLGEDPRDAPRPGIRVAPQQVFVSRLHVRYDQEHFPDDLAFQETGDTSNFQGRYILRHPYTGDSDCGEADRYREELRRRQEEQARNLADLTGWSLDSIRDRLELITPPPGEKKKWWERIWGSRRG